MRVGIIGEAAAGSRDAEAPLDFPPARAKPEAGAACDDCCRKEKKKKMKNMQVNQKRTLIQAEQ